MKQFSLGLKVSKIVKMVCGRISHGDSAAPQTVPGTIC